MSGSDGLQPDYRVRRGELSAYGRAANSAKTLYWLIVLLAAAVAAMVLLTVVMSWPVFAVNANRAALFLPGLLLVAIVSIGGLALTWFYTRRNFIEPDMAFRMWLQQVCDGDLAARIGLNASHAHYKELDFHTRNLASSLNRLSTDMETLVDDQTRRLETQNKSLDLLYNLTADVARETGRQSMLETVCRYLAEWFGAAHVAASLDDGDPAQLLYVETNAAGICSTVRPDVLPLPVQKLTYESINAQRSTFRIKVPIKNGNAISGMIMIETDQYDPAEQARLDRVLTTISEQLSLFLAKQSALEQSRIAQMIRDRNALAADIHDSLAQTMAALRYQITLLQEALQSKTLTALSVDVERIQGTLSEANQEVRGLIQEFRHPLSQHRSADAIRATVEGFRRSSGMQVFFQTDDPQISFSPREESQLQKIIGEALNNAEKYSQASMVRVYLRTDESGVRGILVEDDGIGFTPADKSRLLVGSADNGGNHIGLTIMQERASSIGATLQLESEPGEGTRIAIDLPPLDKFAGD